MGDGGFPPALSTICFGGIAMVSALVTNKNYSLLAIVLWGGSHRHKPHWLSNLSVLRALPLGEGLKSWNTRCGFQKLCSSLLTVWHVLGVEFMQRVCLTLSFHFSMGIFSFAQHVGVTQLVPRFLSEGIFPGVHI